MQAGTHGMTCSFCGEEAKLVDRRTNGLRLILAGLLIGGATGGYFGWVVGVMDWLILASFGLYSVFRAQRFVYRCRQCTNVMVPP